MIAQVLGFCGFMFAAVIFMTWLALRMVRGGK